MYFCVAVIDIQVGHLTALLKAWGEARYIYLALTHSGYVSFDADHLYQRYAGLKCQEVFV